jgi:hypothetical protein
MTLRVTCLVATILGSFLLSACGGSKDSQQATYPIQTQQSATGSYQAQPGQQAAAPGTAQQSYPAQTAQPTAAPQQYPGTQPAAAAAQPAAAAPAATTATGGAAQEVDVSMAAPVQPLLQQLAKTQAPPGAKPMGSLIVANFTAPGQTLQKQVQLSANKCYTVVAAGGPGVSEVNLKFVSLIPLAPPAAVDNTTGPQATLGPNPNCWKQIMFSAPMNLVIEVPQGQGLVGAQIYEK